MASRARLRHVDQDDVVADYEAGNPVRSICEQHRVGWTTLYRILDDHHVPRREPNHAPRIPEHLEKEIAAAYQRGDTVNAIAERCGVSKGTVSNVGRRHFNRRAIVRRREDLVELIVRWLFHGGLDETELDAINRVGVVTRLPGFQAIEHIDPELRPAVVQRVAEAVAASWPER